MSFFNGSDQPVRVHLGVEKKTKKKLKKLIKELRKSNAILAQMVTGLLGMVSSGASVLFQELKAGGYLDKLPSQIEELLSSIAKPAPKVGAIVTTAKILPPTKKSVRKVQVKIGKVQRRTAIKDANDSTTAGEKEVSDQSGGVPSESQSDTRTT